MEILISVVNQKLKISTNLKTIVAGSQEFIKFVFNLDDSWNGLLTFAQFNQNGAAYNIYLDNENSCYLPPEITTGEFELTLYGTGGTIVATTDYLTFKVVDNSIVENEQSTNVSQSLYEQLVDMILAISIDRNGIINFN